MARTYLVECYWPGVTEAAYSASVARLRAILDQDEEVGGAGDRPARGVVRYVDSLLMPADEVVFYRLAAESAAAVEDACSRASIRFERVTGYVERDAPSGTENAADDR